MKGRRLDIFLNIVALPSRVVKRVWIWLLLICLVIDGFLVYRWWGSRGEDRYDGKIVRASRRYKIDPALVKAVVWRESAFDAKARGRAGEVGLMQICGPAAQEWAEAEGRARFSHSQLLDPEDNLMAGAWYLAKLLKRYRHTDNALPYGLADYNAGRSNVLRWVKGPATTNSARFIAQIDFPGTQQYVLAVLKRYQHYRQDLE